MFKKKYEIYPSGNAHILFPCEQVSGTIYFEDGESVYIPFSYSYAPVWGRAGGIHLLDNDNKFALPDSIAIIWYSIVENKFYLVKSSLPKEKIKELLEIIDPELKEPVYRNIVVGMAPYGNLAVWITGSGMQTYVTEVAWLDGEIAEIGYLDYKPDSKLAGEEYCERTLRLNNVQAYENFQKNGLPDRDLFDNYMAKFEYRIIPVFENQEIEFGVSSVRYYNGEVNPVDVMSYDRYQPKAKPYKINISWQDGKDEYDAYFWTDEKKIIETFSDFYKNSQQEKGDFVIEIDKEYKNFRFFLKNDLVEIEIPENEMEIIIFKNTWECYRNENYKRPEGGWRQ
jgi:hypothetical protein